ncbi:DMT family transporter [Massilia sp. 9096]|uniref:DMT family transporter n=1 Tax=Massilia sp. 9096 TaxID=1500894 RepID=UPI00055B05F5|nr:DMT family transporter [Massilia sp. 9096]
MRTRATVVPSVLAMVAFAANSLLCRVALREGHIDPASFGAIRIAAGALVLALLAWLRRGPRPPASGDWRAGAMLFAYVAGFSFAYLTLAAGTGALILFGAVQLTMFAAGFKAGERFTTAGWIGLGLALAGLVVLVLPGVAAPSPLGAALMALAGVAWGGYSLRGRGVPDPIQASAANFVRALPLSLLLALAFAMRAHADARGIALAVVSGALTSGLGYVVWYAALRGLSSLRAAVIQLSVPVLAACGGALWLGEPFTARLALAVAAILGGIALALRDRGPARERERR